MTDDSGPAAMSVSDHLAFLRSECSRMDIKWHPRHKESTLEGMIAKCAAMPNATRVSTESAFTMEVEDLVIKENVDPVFTAQVVKPISANTPADESNLMEVAPPVEQRSIPQDVLDALDYCNGYHRGNTKCIRAYIDEIR